MGDVIDLSSKVLRRREKRRGVIALAGVALLSGGATVALSGASASAATTGAGTLGTVTSIQSSADTFTLKTSAGKTVKVKVTASTTYREGASAKADFADLHVGASVAVVGSTSSGTETAVLVIIGKASSGEGTGASSGPGFGGGFGGFGGGTFGTVTTVQASKHTFQVRLSTGKTVTVKVTGATTYRDGEKKGSFKDVKAGQQVIVTGSTKSGVESAKTIVVGLPKRGAGGFGGSFSGFGGGTFGTVTSVQASKHTFHVRLSTGKTVTVKVTGATTYRDGEKKGSFKDVKAGAHVAVTGSSSSGVEKAKQVTLVTATGARGGFGGFGGGTSGTVTTVQASKHTFHVRLSTGKTVTVKVTSATTYRDGEKKGSFKDVKAGATVSVVGSTSSGVESARTVIIGNFRGAPPAS